jgi:signal transduction histidine kinase
VAQLVRSHGGEIELGDAPGADAPGAGTLVRITWPAFEAGAAA